jgi:uncharacterized sporulation protein YeaH/YhbH (DUF444 family)
MMTPRRDDEQQPLSGFSKLFTALLPTIVGVLVMAGGWVANFSATRTEMADHERRIAILEKNSVPRSEQEAVQHEREKVLSDIRLDMQDLKQDVRNLSDDVHSIPIIYKIRRIHDSPPAPAKARPAP